MLITLRGQRVKHVVVILNFFSHEEYQKVTFSLSFYKLFTLQAQQQNVGRFSIQNTFLIHFFFLNSF